MVQSKSLWCASTLVVAALLAQSTLAANIYRYVDKNGQTVFNTVIPPEYVKNGYTILNEAGQVIQEVPRALTAQEIEAQKAGKAAEEQAIADRVAQEEADQLLIRLFRSPEEIQRKRDNSLLQLKTQEDLVKLNMGRVDAEIARVQAIIDNNAKAGTKPPADIPKKMESEIKEKQGYEAQLAKLATDRAKLIDDAARDAKRLRELMGLPPAELAPPPAADAATPEAEAASAEKPAAQ